MRTLILLGVAALAVAGNAWSDVLAQPPPAAAATVAAPATPAPAAAVAPAAPVAAAEAPQPFKPPPGYKVRVVKGETLYCRKQATIGSRFEETICMNESQLKQMLIVQDDTRARFSQSVRVCGSGCTRY